MICDTEAEMQVKGLNKLSQTTRVEKNCFKIKAL